MAKRPLRIPDRSEITDDTPLHLATAAALAFPDGSVSALALRNAASRGELEHMRIGARVLTTLGWIKEFMERNRYPATRLRDLEKQQAEKTAERDARLRAAAAIRAGRRAPQKQ